MKVVLLAATPPPVGGIATWTMRMLNIDPEFNCEYILVDEKMIGGRDMFGNNKRSLRNEWKRCRGIWNNLKKAVSDPAVEMVQSCISAETFPMIREYICARIAKKYKKKFVMHFHCTVPNMKDSILWGPLLNRIVKMSDMIFVLNKQSEKYLQKIAKSEVVVIPNFVEKQEILEKHEIKERISNVLYVGGVIESKGVGDIIEVAKLNPDICFKLAGNPETSIVEKAKSVKNVMLLGQIDRERVKQELRDSDVFMFLSRFPGEGFSLALLEAMAAGLPCIVTDWAANGDMISDEGGITIKDYSISTVSKALRDMQDPNVRKMQSVRNIETVKQFFSAETVFGQFVTAYERCLLRDGKRNRN